jgi:hypothetical protein
MNGSQVAGTAVLGNAPNDWHIVGNQYDLVQARPIFLLQWEDIACDNLSNTSIDTAMQLCV